MSEEKSFRIALVRTGGLKQQHHLTTLCKFLIEQGVSIQFISVQAPIEEVEWFGREVPGIAMCHCGELPSNGIKRFFLGGLALRRKMGQLQFDILYIVDSWTLPYVALATNGTMTWGKLPTVYHTFDMLVPNVAPRFYIALERHAALRSKLNINADRSRAEVTKVLFGLKQTPLSVPLRLPRHASLPVFDKHLRESLLATTEIDVTKYLVVNPTGLSKERQGKEIIQAFASLPEEYHLVTIEGGGLYGRECCELVARLGIQDRVRLLSPLPHDDLLKICACADVGLIFHDIEGSLGNYLCHPSRLAYFLALGLPVIASDVPVLEGVIYRYGLGVCCASTEPPSIAGAIKEVCNGNISLSERRKGIRHAFETDLYYERSAVYLLSALKAIT